MIKHNELNSEPISMRRVGTKVSPIVEEGETLIEQQYFLNYQLHDSKFF